MLGQSELDDLLSRREEINLRLQRIIDEQTEPWGIKVSIVEVKDVELPESLKRAMAAQAEAEREKRAKVISAEGEFVASLQLTNAAAVMAPRTDCTSTALSSNLDHDCRRKEFHDHFPAAVGTSQCLQGDDG